MIKDDIERILKERGWVRTISSSEELIDYQKSEPYNRLVIEPDDFKFVTKEVLEKLMSIDIVEHGEVLNKAEADYYKSQARFDISPEKGLTLETEERKMREQLKKFIDDAPVEDLSGLLGKFMEYYRRPKEEKPVVKKWEKREKETPVTISEEGARVAVIEMATDKDTDVAEQAFTALVEDKKVYRSAVIVDSTVVRTVEQEKDRKGETVVKFNTASYENALGVTMLFDGTLRKEITIVRVTRAERKLSVSYIVTGIKIPPKKAKKIKTGSVFEENGTLQFLKKRRGE